MKSAPLTLLLVSMILSSFLQIPIVDSSTAYAPRGICDSKCGVRCLNAGVMDRCLKYCGVCCKICNCVPSGTYGNKSECPCYRDKLNSKGKSKCP